MSRRVPCWALQTASRVLSRRADRVSRRMPYCHAKCRTLGAIPSVTPKCDTEFHDEYHANYHTEGHVQCQCHVQCHAQCHVECHAGCYTKRHVQQCHAHLFKRVEAQLLAVTGHLTQNGLVDFLVVTQALELARHAILLCPLHQGGLLWDDDRHEARLVSNNRSQHQTQSRATFTAVCAAQWLRALANVFKHLPKYCIFVLLYFITLLHLLLSVQATLQQTIDYSIPPPFSPQDSVLLSAFIQYRIDEPVFSVCIRVYMYMSLVCLSIRLSLSVSVCPSARLCVFTSEVVRPSLHLFVCLVFLSISVCSAVCLCRRLHSSARPCADSSVRRSVCLSARPPLVCLFVSMSVWQWAVPVGRLLPSCCLRGRKPGGPARTASTPPRSSRVQCILPTWSNQQEMLQLNHRTATPRKCALPSGHLDFESAVTAQNDEFKSSSHSSPSRSLNVMNWQKKTPCW